MDAITDYLIKSTVWLTGFALVYLLFLRNERFFTLNRIFLVTGVFASICFPWLNFHYTVLLPMVPITEVVEPQMVAAGVVQEEPIIQNLLLYAYLSGILYLVFQLLKQTYSVIRVIRKSGTTSFNSIRLVRTDRYPAPFSFFSFVFVNPSTHDAEINEIVHHEQQHIRQRHWIDLLLFEVLCTIQWFNPIAWLYGRFIRQNHEYLADAVALRRTSNPAMYRAALLNQMFGGPVIELANSFNYSLNKKRFNMMKQTISSPIRKLKLLLVLPLMAGVFYAFATPEYKFVTTENKPAKEQISAPDNTKAVKGKVVDENGKPLKGASIVVSGKTIGTTSDINGHFKLELDDDSPIEISYVGFKTVKTTPDFGKEMTITMKKKVVTIDAVGNKPSDSKVAAIPGAVLYLVDRKEISKEEMEKIKPESIESITVLKNESATVLYGEKGKNGVVLITMKKGQASENQSANTDVKVTEYANNQEAKQKTGNLFVKDGEYYFDKVQPLIVIDGVVSEKLKMDDIDPNTIESIKVLKDEMAITKYGVKGKNGVLEIKIKKPGEVFTMVEEMPQFPGGTEALKSFVYSTLKYPAIALENGICGQVFVKFVVSKTGSVTNAIVSRGVDPSLDKEAVRIVEAMPKWIPGKQNGEAVDVAYELPVNFNFPKDYHPKSKEKLRTK